MVLLWQAVWLSGKTSFQPHRVCCFLKCCFGDFARECYVSSAKCQSAIGKLSQFPLMCFFLLDIQPPFL
jgi:hypothetical protein